MAKLNGKDILLFLKGAKGEQGPQGAKGDKGDKGASIKTAKIEDGKLVITLTDGTILPAVNAPIKYYMHRLILSFRDPNNSKAVGEAHFILYNGGNTDISLAKFYALIGNKNVVPGYVSFTDGLGGKYEYNAFALYGSSPTGTNKPDYLYMFKDGVAVDNKGFYIYAFTVRERAI